MKFPTHYIHRIYDDMPEPRRFYTCMTVIISIMVGVSIYNQHLLLPVLCIIALDRIAYVEKPWRKFFKSRDERPKTEKVKFTFWEYVGVTLYLVFGLLGFVGLVAMMWKIIQMGPK